MNAGEQSFDLAPSPAPLRARDYSITAAFPLTLIGRDAMTAGDSTLASENPPRAAARASDYTWLQTLPLLTTQILPAGESSQQTEGPPRGPLRARDYTHLDLTKRNLIGQDSMIVGESTFISDLPPRPYPRAQVLRVPDTNNMIGLLSAPVRDLAYTFSLAGGHWESDLGGSHWASDLAGSRWGSDVTGSHWESDLAGSHWDFGPSQE
jgi:hypothetical protein